ncbi:MAG: hypothetical protein ABI266_01020 [Ginsengibacter sp.]
MKLIKLSALVFIITSFIACNTDRPYKVLDIHEGTPTNADTVLYNLHHGGAESIHEGTPVSESHTQQNNKNLPRVFWR